MEPAEGDGLTSFLQSTFPRETTFAPVFVRAARLVRHRREPFLAGIAAAISQRLNNGKTGTCAGGVSDQQQQQQNSRRYHPHLFPLRGVSSLLFIPALSQSILSAGFHNTAAGSFVHPRLDAFSACVLNSSHFCMPLPLTNHASHGSRALYAKPHLIFQAVRSIPLCTVAGTIHILSVPARFCNFWYALMNTTLPHAMLPAASVPGRRLWPDSSPLPNSEARRFMLCYASMGVAQTLVSLVLRISCTPQIECVRARPFSLRVAWWDMTCNWPLLSAIH
jgi:hypothetical protein